MKYYLHFIVFLFSFKTHSSFIEVDLAWDLDSAPEIMVPQIERRLLNLPLYGFVQKEKRLWSGNYWPLKEGNINFRWFGRKKNPIRYSSPDEETVRRLSIPQLAELSPAEKYDLFLGHYDYPFKREVEKISNPRALAWEGICHGWSPASINHNEPLPKLMKNPDGIEIPFGSTDIKALLSFYYAYYHKVKDTHQMGKRCFNIFKKDGHKNCLEDLNAGSFHLVLANRIGLEGKSFILDIQRSKEVWNHPISSFKSKIMRMTRRLWAAAPGTIQQVEIMTQIQVVVENGFDWGPVLGTKKQGFRNINYRYLLDINHEGEIIGGRWLSLDRPDFIWSMPPPSNFKGILEKVRALLDDF